MIRPQNSFHHGPGENRKPLPNLEELAGFSYGAGIMKASVTRQHRDAPTSLPHSPRRLPDPRA